MSEAPVYRILVAVDYSDLAELALRTASRIASERPATELIVVAVAEGQGPRLPEELTEDVKREFIDEARDTLEAYVAEQLDGTPEGARDNVRVEARFGSPAHEIVKLGSELDCDVIVLGTHGRRGFRRLVLGSVAEAVVRSAGCSVLVVRPKQPDVPD